MKKTLTHLPKPKQYELAQVDTDFGIRIRHKDIKKKLEADTSFRGHRQRHSRAREYRVQ
ncbi:MAG: hypothetical protein JXB29_12245 [Sedimentisphaerales bacterium]|nr:hypothetical protein [Sedimentisphaerales bacterium]